MSDRDALLQIKAIVEAALGIVPPPVGETCEQFVRRMYRDVLRQEADADGLTHWTNQCASGAMTREAIEAAFRAVVQPPPPPPPDTGNPSTIVPAWGAWNEVYPRPGFTFQPSTVYAFPVPVNPTPGQEKVTLYIGQTPSQAPAVGFELCLSRAPGVVDRSDASRFLSTGEGGFRNNLSFEVWQRQSAWNPTREREGFPDQGTWYLNVRALSAAPSVHSLQWNN